MKKRLKKAAIMKDVARMRWILDDHEMRSKRNHENFNKLLVEIFGY